MVAEQELAQQLTQLEQTVADIQERQRNDERLLERARQEIARIHALLGHASHTVEPEVDEPRNHSAMYAYMLSLLEANGRGKKLALLPSTIRFLEQLGQEHGMVEHHTMAPLARIVGVLKERGPLTTGQLTQELKVTAVDQYVSTARTGLRFSRWSIEKEDETYALTAETAAAPFTPDPEVGEEVDQAIRFFLNANGYNVSVDGPTPTVSASLQRGATFFIKEKGRANDLIPAYELANALGTTVKLLSSARLFRASLNGILWQAGINLIDHDGKTYRMMEKTV